MLRCPYCDAEIDYLIKKYIHTWIVKPIYDKGEIVEESAFENIIWVCPICDGEIASSPDEVIDFFQHGGE